MAYLVAYIASAVVFLICDAAWLSFAGPRLYRPLLGDLLAPKVSPAPGIAFYLIYLAGVLILATAPALRSGGWTRAGFAGLVLGLCAYATYDLTNQATLRHWPLKLTLIDLSWGAGLTGVAAVAGYFAARLVAGGAR